MSRENAIKRAHNYYDNCELIIKDMCALTEGTEAVIDEDRAVTEFDIIMLSLLFSQAIVDGDFCKEEVEFIKSFPNADNFFKFFTIEEDKELTWDKVFNMDNSQQKALASGINDLLNDTANEFAFKFAVIDAVSPENELVEIALNLAQIALLLSEADGESSSEEIDLFQTYTKELILGKWAYYVNAIDGASGEDVEEYEYDEESESGESQ